VTQTEKAPAQELGDSVARDLAARAPGPSDTTDAAAAAVYGYLFPFLAASDTAVEAAGAAAAGALAGAKKLTAPVWHVARGALVGVLHAGLGRRLELAPLARAATAALMREADAQGGDFGAAAQGAVEGTIVACDELGLDPSELASIVAEAALETAETLGEGAPEKVRHLVTRRVMGVTVRAPRPQGTRRG